MITNAHIPDISVDLSWIDMLKGIAIIGVFLDNWTEYMVFAATPAFLYSLGKTVALAVGPFVQVFFILSGLGLTVAYFRQYKTNWSWKQWAWRRISKIVIPYYIFVIFSFVLGIVSSNLYQSVNLRFSWSSLLTYLTFTRNFYPSSWVWNIPLWFMPVIIGLYISFPVLIGILKKWGVGWLLLISAFVCYGTLTFAVVAGASRSHGADLFTFWMVQFAFGMVLAYARETTPQKLRLLIGLGAFLFGITLMIASWALRTYVPLGKVFNDSLTSMGIFLVLLNVVWTGRARVPAIGTALTALSSKSYFMYLMHYPVMQFLIGPLIRVPTNPVIVIILGFVYIILIFIVCYFISRPIERFTSWAYRSAGFIRA